MEFYMLSCIYMLTGEFDKKNLQDYCKLLEKALYSSLALKKII